MAQAAPSTAAHELLDTGALSKYNTLIQAVLLCGLQLDHTQRAVVQLS